MMTITMRGGQKNFPRGYLKIYKSSRVEPHPLGVEKERKAALR